MNSRIKDILGAAGALAALLLGIAGMSYANTYSKAVEPSSFRSFSASGEGKVIAVPDVARFDFTVLTDGGTDVANLQQKNTERMNKVIAFVKEKGVDAKDIKTEYYSLDPRYESYNCVPAPYNSVRPCPPAEIVGYTVRQSVTVKIRDFAKIGGIMGGIVEQGANQVGSLSFTVDDPAKLRDQAREEAIAKAKESAESLARAGGFRIGRLLSIDENGGGYPMYDKYAYGRGGEMVALSAAPAAAPVPSIEPGSQDIIVSVNLRYEIE